MEKSCGSYKFKQDGKILKLSEVVYKMKEDKKTYQLAKLGKSNYLISQIFGGVGGFMVGWNLGSAAAGKNISWTGMGIGGGLIAISIPFSIRGKKYMKKALKRYNAQFPETAGRIKIDYKLVVNGQGVGWVLSF